MSDIVMTREGPVAVLTLDRLAKHNAMTQAMQGEVAALLEDLARQERPRAGADRHGR